MIIVKAGCKKNKRLRVGYGVDHSGFYYVNKKDGKKAGKVWWDKETGEVTQVFCSRASQCKVNECKRNVYIKMTGRKDGTKKKLNNNIII